MTSTSGGTLRHWQHCIRIWMQIINRNCLSIWIPLNSDFTRSKIIGLSNSSKWKLIDGKLAFPLQLIASSVSSDILGLLCNWLMNSIIYWQINLLRLPHPNTFTLFKPYMGILYQYKLEAFEILPTNNEHIGILYDLFARYLVCAN